MSNLFALVATVTSNKVYWDVQFTESIDVAITELIRRTGNEINAAYGGC